MMGGRKLLARAALLVLVGAVLLPSSASAGGSRATDQGFTSLDVKGEQVQIYRDAYGVPHIFADTNRGLFEAYGYTVAQDRLWQLELLRREAEGRLAEVFGPSALPADENARTLGYTGAELDAQFAALPAEDQEIIQAYTEGINRYIDDVVARDPTDKLPFEFHSLGIGVPEPWTVRDLVAVAVAQVVNPPNSGTRELANQSLLASLIKKFGSQDGLGVFNDVRWLNDPDAPVTVPAEGANGKRQKPPAPDPAQLAGASETPPETLDDAATGVLHSLGLSTGFGSHGWVVSPAKSANGSAMLFGGPQIGFNTPENFYEVQLHGGNGFDVTGAAVPNIPAIFAGRTDHIAWTLTTARAVDNTDTYVETLCDGGYVFDGACRPFQARVETIDVRGAQQPFTLTVRRTVHGPVVASGPPGSGVVFSLKRAMRNRELQEAQAFLTIDRARNLQEFRQGVGEITDGLNFLYADQLGNIAYWQAGLVPVRPPGFDPRLPLPGTGSAEWTGEYKPLPSSVNPVRGWLANWNGKPTVDWDNPDHQTYGKQDRVREIEARLGGPGKISLADMRSIEQDVARSSAQGSIGRASRFLKPYLLHALDQHPPSNPLAQQAQAVLEAWDGSLYADARASTNAEPGQVIFTKWLDLMLQNTFGDELGANVSQASPNMLIHALDDALGGGSGVPPSRDYFNGALPNVVMSNTFDQALTALGPDPAAWSSVPRQTIQFQRPDEFPTIPSAGGLLDPANRGTYAQIIVLGNPTITSENILDLGESGFIGTGPDGAPVLDPHFNDQLPLYRDYHYKPMNLYRNTQLQQ